MKKILSLFLALLMTITLIGCEKEKSEKDEAEEYIEEAEELIEDGDYEGAIEVLKEGLEETDSKEIAKLLEELENLSLSPIPENPVTIPIGATNTDIIEPTEAPIITEPITPIETTPQASQDIVCVFYYNGETCYARLEDFSDPSKYMTSEEEVERICGSNYMQWDYRNQYGDNLLAGDKDIQGRINLFLSNFAEVCRKTYPESEYEMLNFVLSHCKINNRSAVKESPDSYYISATDVNNTLTMFLGKTLSPSSGQTFTHPNSTSPYDVITYKDGNYHYPLADGVMTDYVAIATNMHANPDGTYYVAYDVYFVPNGVEKAHYEMNSANVENNSNFEFQYSAYAVVRDYTRESKQKSYQLLDMGF